METFLSKANFNITRVNLSALISLSSFDLSSSIPHHPPSSAFNLIEKSYFSSTPKNCNNLPFSFSSNTKIFCSHLYTASAYSLKTPFILGTRSSLSTLTRTRSSLSTRTGKTIHSNKNISLFGHPQYSPFPLKSCFTLFANESTITQPKENLSPIPSQPLVNNTTPSTSFVPSTDIAKGLSNSSNNSSEFIAAVALAKKHAQQSSSAFQPDKPLFPYINFKVAILISVLVISSGYTYSYCLEKNITPKQFVDQVLEITQEKQFEFNDFLNDMFEKYFPKPNEDLLPDSKELNYPDYIPTLVIDFDKTIALVEHNRKDGWQIIKRPGADRFFRELINYYEIIIWSDDVYPVASEATMKWGIPVMGCIHRDQCKKRRGHYVKDISRLGRKIERTIILDHDAFSFMQQPENGLLIREFTGDPEDRELDSFIDLLKSIALSMDDVRTTISKYKQYGTDSGYQFMVEKAKADKKAENRRTFGKTFGVGSNRTMLGGPSQGMSFK